MKSRYQLVDTATGEVVREQASIYGKSRNVREPQRLLTPLDQERLTWCLIGLVLGMALF